MEISKFEQELKTTIDPKLSIRANKHHADIAGVYWGDRYTDIAVPQGNIYDDKNSSYTDAWGFAHKTRPEAIAQIRHFFWRMQNEEGFMDEV